MPSNTDTSITVSRPRSQEVGTKLLRYLTRRNQAERYGKSVRTIERWGLDQEMAMPPEYDFNGVKARREDDLERWERARVAHRA
jgi:hypothetical protein